MKTSKFLTDAKRELALSQAQGVPVNGIKFQITSANKRDNDDIVGESYSNLDEAAEAFEKALETRRKESKHMKEYDYRIFKLNKYETDVLELRIVPADSNNNEVQEALNKCDTILLRAKIYEVEEA